MSVALSVVVPVLDMADTIGACLDSLTSQRLPAGECEVLVVDNGSTDGTPDVVRRYPVILLHEPKPGACNARNAGIAAARGEFVAFTDADCVPSRSWLASLRKAAARPDVDVIAGPLAVLDPECSLLARYSATVGQYDPTRTLAHPTFPYAASGNMCIRRSVLEANGRFNPAFPTYDAAEFFWRLKQRGPLRVVVERRAVVFYRTRSSIRAFARQNFGYGCGAGQLLRQATGSRGAAVAGAALRNWRARLRDASPIVRAAARESHRTAASLFGLHLLRETAIAAGFLAASGGPRR